jgi:hypothetical protein
MAIDKRTQDILNKRNQELQLKEQLRAELAEGVEANDVIAEVSTHSEQAVARSGQTSQQMITGVQTRIDNMLQMGFFDSLPTASRDAWPSLLCRLPIFLPINRPSQKKLLNDDNALVFSTPFGSGERHGPNLDTFDEDVLLAISRLRAKKLRGEHDKLPLKVSKLYKGDDRGRVDVEIVVCTVSQIIDELGYKTFGGKSYEDIKDAIKRLGNTSITLTLNAHDRYLGSYERGKPFKILDVEWGAFSSESIFYIQFSPLVTSWLDDSFSYLNHEIRKSLGRKNIAKGLHKFLSTQPKNYSRKIEDIASTLGLFVPLKEARRQLENACADLIEVGFLADYKMEGSGRKTPIILTTVRV